jgi:hypothetical protein
MCALGVGEKRDKDREREREREREKLLAEFTPKIGMSLQIN